MKMGTFPQKRYMAVLLAAAFGAWSHSAWAADVQYKISGFGTLGVAKTDNDDTGFRNYVDQARGAGKTLDLGLDSRAALQGSVIYKENFTVTAQLLGRRRDTDDFDVGFEWLYAQYTGVPGLDVKAGRVVLPAFLVSDSRLVGYSVPWVRVPTLVYGMMPLSNVDGGQAGYRHTIGSAVVSAQVTAGNAAKSSFHIASTNAVSPGVLAYVTTDAQTDVTHIFGINAAIEWGDWTARISQIQDHTALDGMNTLLPFGPMAPFAGIAPPTPSLITFHDKFQEAGLQYDNGKLLVTTEYVRRLTDPKIQEANAWYVGTGYRFGPVMPYVLVSQYHETFSAGDKAPKATGNAVGVRYDFATNLALKGEWAQYKNNSLYNFTDAVTPPVAGKKINVLSAALDFVF